MAIKPTDLSGVNPTGTPSAVDVMNAGNAAISFREQLPDLEGKLREALTSKFMESPLFKQRETAAQEFLSAPSAIRADISNMQQTSGVPLSPTQQEAITGSRRAAAFAPLSTANLMLNTQFGGLENMMAGGVKAFEAASTAQTDRANLMDRIRQQEIDRSFKEKQFQLDLAKLSIAQQKANAPAKLSASERLKAARYESGLKQIDRFTKLYKDFTGTGPVKGTLTNLFKNILPGLADPYLAGMQSDIGPLREQITNAISGANVSAQEAKRVMSWIPANTKSPQENQRNLESLKAWLNDNYEVITGEPYDAVQSSYEEIMDSLGL